MSGKPQPEASERRAKPLISVEETADLIGVSRSVAYRWARLGCLPGAVNLGGRWYVRRLPILAWLAGGDAVPTPSPTPDELADARQTKAAGHAAARERA